MQHPALASGNVAVITGAADGIGLATAEQLLKLGLNLCIADIDAEKLAKAEEQLSSLNQGELLAVVTDVSKPDELQKLKDSAYEKFNKVNVLMNNAGIIQPGIGSWTDYDKWMSTLSVNLIGVINGIHSFVPGMLEQGHEGLVINTGSKQGITSPPGNPAYNVSKAGVKAVTEALAHSFRNTENCKLTAHLLVPGFTYSGMVRKWVADKPEAAWTSSQVAEFLLEHINRGDFYILCPDNDVSREMDNKRMAWAMGDLIENRPALSRWHPDYASAFDAFMNS